MNAPVAMSSDPRAAPRGASRRRTSGIVDVVNYGRGRDGADPALGRRGRPADAGLHLRGRDAVACRRRDLLHLAARHPGPAPGARPLPRAALRPALRTRSASSSRSAACTAMQIAVRMIAGAGDEVVIPTPAWPNFAGALSIAGAPASQVPMTSTVTGWQLDLDRLDARRSRRARARSSSTRRPTRPAGPRAATSCAAILSHRPAARPLDHRRRDLCPLRLRPGAHDRGPRAVLPGRHGAGGPRSCSSRPSPRTGP